MGQSLIYKENEELTQNQNKREIK